MRKKIYFQKLVNQHCPYTPVDQLQILEWMFKTGKDYDIWTGRWSKDGIDKLIYDYSANTFKSHTKIKDWKHVRLMFINAIVPETPIQKWRDEMGITLSGSKFMKFDSSQKKYLQFNGKDIFQILKSLEGKELKKDFFQPDYPERTNPFIESIKFTISVSGCHILLNYTFENCIGSLWTEEFFKRDESMYDFFLNGFKIIDSWLITPQILSNDK